MTAAQVALPPRDDNVLLQVSVGGGDRPFRLGEKIPLELRFSSAVPSRYEINKASYDRSGRMEYERFALTPAEGAVDPMASAVKSGIAGGLTSFQYLSDTPWTLVLHLNEWVRFTKPGRYEISITSMRVGVKDATRTRGTSQIIVAAAPVTVTIVAATAEWQRSTLDAAVAVLNRPAPPAAIPGSASYDAQRDAVDTLRFLGTADATRELARFLGSGAGNSAAIASLGLISSPERDAARQALEAEIADPAREIDPTFIYTLQALTTTSRNQDDIRQAREKIVNAVVAALPAKRGPARATTVATLANEAFNGATLTASAVDAIVMQLVATFDQLPATQQSFLLSDRWDRIARPEIVPHLRRLALADPAPNPRGGQGSPESQVAAIALRRWFELDPAAARPAVLAEIARPAPRFDAKMLGFLPEQTLPEVERALADHFDATDGFPVAGHLASLIARYGSGAILDRALAKIDPRLGQWACDIQNPILAFALRIDPAKARPRIEQALASRGQRFSHCYDTVLSSIAAMEYDPLLEHIATKQLDDPDAGARGDAAAVLSQYGSASAEALLLDRFKKWSETWAGREAELSPTFSDPVGTGEGVAVGARLAQALVNGSAWLSDPARLDVLAPLARGPRVRQIIDMARQMWNRTPFAISAVRFGAGMISARVVQYDLRSIEALERKLAQFPAGTRFSLALSQADVGWARETEIRLRAFLADHRMVLVER